MDLHHGQRTKLANALAATLAIGLLAGCSPDDGAVAGAATDTRAGADPASPEPPAPSRATTPTGNRPTGNRGIAADEAPGACALLTPAEINAAFDGAIQVVVDSGSDRVCDYRIVGHEGQMLLQPMDAGTYDGRKAAYSQGNYGGIEPVAVPGLGQDAYLMGDAQIEVLVDDRQGFNLGLQLLVVGKPPVTPEQSRAAMVELARSVAERL